MGQEKRAFSLRLDAALHEQLARQAKIEGRTPANLAEVLITWSFRKLLESGNSLLLIGKDGLDSEITIEEELRPHAPKPRSATKEKSS